VTRPRRAEAPSGPAPVYAGHNLSLVFSDLTTQAVEPGRAPFVVPDGGPDFKIPLP
jgi:hypothetical protein